MKDPIIRSLEEQMEEGKAHWAKMQEEWAQGIETFAPAAHEAVAEAVTHLAYDEGCRDALTWKTPARHDDEDYTAGWWWGLLNKPFGTKKDSNDAT